MLFILEPKKVPIALVPQIEPLGGGWNYLLDYSWIIKNIVYFKNKKLILDVGCGKRSKLGKYLENVTGTNVVRLDRQPNIPGALHVPDFLKYNPKYKPDVIYWASSIEHNSIEEIKKLYKHSMDLLERGGLFLATIALSSETFWQEKTKQTNLSLQDAIDIFNVEKIFGDFYLSKDQYKENVLNLKDKYIKRFGKFDPNDPIYIVGGIKKFKE